MTMHYDFWMTLGALAVAMGAAFACAQLSRRLRTAQHKTPYVLIAVPVFGLALWTVSFASILVAHGAVAPELDVPLGLLSIEAALICSAAAVAIGRHGHLRGLRLPALIVALVTGALVTRYFAVAALHIVPAPNLTTLSLALFAIGAAVAAYCAFGLGARWFVASSIARRIAAAALAGLAGWALHVWFLPIELAIDPFRRVAATDSVTVAYVACGVLTTLLAAVSYLPARARESGLPDGRLAG